MSIPQYKQMTDDSLMPFGKHKGKRMEDVPASYLHWWWCESGRFQIETSNVADYINRNLRTLEQEYPDGLWNPEELPKR